MKTLDEVISEFRECEKYPDCKLCEYGGHMCMYIQNALHYLLEYRMMMDDIAEKRETLEEKISHYCDLIKIETDHYALSKVRWAEEYKNIKDDYEALQDFWAESQANPPLTWDELKGMEGKPVWVESVCTEKKHAGWVVVKRILAGAILTEPRLFYSEVYGKQWIAYRHERT